jgi:hypothetical protein
MYVYVSFIRIVDRYQLLPGTLDSAGSIIVKQIGHAILTIQSNDGELERYLITLPRLRIDGLWYGSPYIELADTSYVIGGGYISTLEYRGKGYFSGKSHSFKSTTVPIPGQGGAGPKEVAVEGTWHESCKYTKGGSGTFYEVPVNKEEVIPLEWCDELGEYETRKLWNLVAKGIREGDFDLASKDKSRIENEQRQKRKEEQSAGTKWELKHFEHKENDPVCKCFSSLLLYLFSICVVSSDEQLGRTIKLNTPTEDMYDFKGNWPSGFSALQPH